MFGGMDYPIRVSVRTGRQAGAERIRCDLCDSTRVKVIKTVAIPGTDPPMKDHYCECRNRCLDLRSGRPHVFKVTGR